MMEEISHELGNVIKYDAELESSINIVVSNLINILGNVKI